MHIIIIINLIVLLGQCMAWHAIRTICIYGICNVCTHQLIQISADNRFLRQRLVADRWPNQRPRQLAPIPISYVWTDRILDRLLVYKQSIGVSILTMLELWYSFWNGNKKKKIDFFINIDDVAMVIEMSIFIFIY